MEAVVGLLVMILGVCHGVETSCDGRYDGAQCYGALGGTLVLQLMDSASEIHRYQWTKQTQTQTQTRIFDLRSNQISFNAFSNRSSFTPSNGTFQINDLSRNDEGEYKLEIFDSSGHRSEQRTLLTIQVPVSSVQLVSECLSQGEMRVFCSSEGGDSPQYSWTLDGRTLTDAELLSGNTETNSITLKQHVSGRLLCTVSNQVNSVSTEENITNCGFIFINCTINDTNIAQWVFKDNNTLCITTTTAPTTVKETSTVGNLPIMAGVLSALVLLLVVGVAVICAQKKKQNNKPNENDEQELTYADVRILQRQGRQMQQRAETEVEYGQVKFSERPRQTVEPAQDECVYSKVRRGR